MGAAVQPFAEIQKIKKFKLRNFLICLFFALSLKLYMRLKKTVVAEVKNG